MLYMCMLMQTYNHACIDDVMVYYLNEIYL